ncbi:BlaI/MecI/CopY family transcriptional regulator [Planctomicrobium sp. SH527]|uniref:BlaI/MecI/CopY family transcriptional regulator n=1 Tax=Planctomicrobium sp. SH527 TaxID=3448123 RepID=UPI003F5BD092
MKAAKPSELELQVLGVLWEQGPLSVRDLLPLLPDGKERAYTTVLTILQGMERKKLVTHRREGLTHIYRPLVTHEEVVQPVLKTMLNHLFSGNPAKVVQALMNATEISAEDLKQIRKVISQAAREAGKNGDEQ